MHVRELSVPSRLAVAGGDDIFAAGKEI